jgi:glyoxylase-like metal-dependent hydrolase (beta-lactamase superfamily II)/rhodanese-related sulfurtransferase
MTTESSITHDTLRTWLEQGRPVTLLDVRPLVERAEWAIPGSRHIDIYDRLKAGDVAALADVDLPVDIPIVTICAAGRTSEIAAEQLRARGLHALSLEGGMRAWSLAWNTAALTIPGSTARVIQLRRTGKGCLSYLIGADGMAAVIDPSLDPAVYLTVVEQSGWRITNVLETHLHADHLSRAQALAVLSGAALVLPAGHSVSVPFAPLGDGATVRLGSAHLTVLHTPGHTPESVTYLLDNAALFTGDTLFLAAVGRPDLHTDADGARAKAHMLYHSLQHLLALPAETYVLPAHTSAPVAFDQQPIYATLADVRSATPLLAADEDAFVAAVLARIPPTPPNHAQIIALNERGAPLPVDPTELEAGANRCAIA